MSQTLSGNQLTLTINDVASRNYALSNVKVKFGEQLCEGLTGTFASFTCNLPTNADGTPTLEAGSYIAIIKVNGEGIIDTDASVTAIPIPFSLSSLTPSSGENNGGYEIEIAGVGLPLNV